MKIKVTNEDRELVANHGWVWLSTDGGRGAIAISPETSKRLDQIEATAQARHTLEQN